MRRPVLSVGRRVRLRHARTAVELVLEPGHRVLDAGCSDGRLAGELARAHPDSRIIGVDVEEESLARARREAEGLPNLSVERGEIGGAPVGSDFDVVVCADVLEHIRDDANAFRWLGRSLRPGGHLIVHVPADAQEHPLASVGAALQAEVEAGAGPHVRMGYTPEQLRRLVEAAGLEPVEIAWTFHRAGTRVAADVDTWTYLRGRRLIKLVLLPALLGLAALERAPSRSERGNGLLVTARSR